jgi:hypothetical protein
MDSMEGRIGLLEGAWLVDHPAVAERWAIQVADAGIPLDDHAAQLRETQAKRDAERGAAIEQFQYWAQRAAFLDHLMREAKSNMAQAQRECSALGVREQELRDCLGRATAPGVAELLTARPRHSGRSAAASAASDAKAGSGFFVFYSESGFDSDGDGDVDGGLIDSVSEGLSDAADATGEAAEGFLDSLGGLF